MNLYTTIETVRRSQRRKWVALGCLAAAGYVVVGMMTGRFVYRTMCHPTTLDAEFAAIFWPVVLPLYSITLAVPCDNTPEEAPDAAV